MPRQQADEPTRNKLMPDEFRRRAGVIEDVSNGYARDVYGWRGCCRFLGRCLIPVWRHVLSPIKRHDAPPGESSPSRSNRSRLLESQQA